MLLEEYVADRVRASETAAATRELELLRVIRADDTEEPAGGWLARRRAARAQRARRRDVAAQTTPDAPVQTTPDAPPPVSLNVPTAAAPEERATERELQHAGR